MMARRTLALLLLVMPVAGLQAQATGDQARLVFSFYGGSVPGRSLWEVNGQPLVDDVLGVTDALRLTRQLGSTWTGGLGVTYFKGANIGLTADLAVIATKLVDNCAMLTNSGSLINPEVCNSINGSNGSRLSTAFSVGGIFRVASRQAISPYLRAQGGAFLISQSTTAMTGFFIGDDQQPRFIDIYPQDGNSSIRPQVSVGVGVTIPFAKAYQFRLEGRSTTYGIPVVAGATARQFIIPPTETKYVTQVSILLGVDLVLERKRGRRY